MGFRSGPFSYGAHEIAPFFILESTGSAQGNFMGGTFLSNRIDKQSTDNLRAWEMTITAGRRRCRRSAPMPINWARRLNPDRRSIGGRGGVSAAAAMATSLNSLRFA